MAFLPYEHVDLEGPPAVLSTNGVSSIWALTNLNDVHVYSSKSLQNEESSGGLLTSVLKCNNVPSSGWAAQLENGFAPDSSIIVEGIIPLGTRWFAVILNVNNPENMAYICMARINYSPCNIAHNAMFNGEWGVEENVALRGLVHGEPFTITITCLPEGFRTLINGTFLSYFKHRRSPYEITRIRLDGAMHSLKITYKSKKQSFGGLFTRDLISNNVIAADWVHQLDNGFPVDSSITVAGFIPQHVKSFSINLGVNFGETIALHVNPRFEQNCIVRNSLENGQWGTEERGGSLPWKPGGNFEIKITCLSEGFSICINGKYFDYFEHRLLLHNITHVLVDGSVELRKVTYVSKEDRQYFGGLFSSDLDRTQFISSDWTHKLNNGFTQGSTITVTGFVPKYVKRFSINLDVNSSENVALHFSPRFDQSCIVRNSKENDQWGTEQRDGSLPLRQGENFEIKISSHSNGLSMTINRKYLLYFVHRLPPQNITHVRVQGSVDLQKVTYNFKELLLLEEKIWKMEENQMKVIETCSGGVTWGITEDVPSVCLRGERLLVNGERIIQGTTDVCVLDVWENQTWNSWRGYSSVGIPANRPMWSDITGCHKRTKETTRLLSNYWEWVNDWSVDLQAPDGVDSDGWQYATDFKSSFHGCKGIKDRVRRRRWIRTCKLTLPSSWVPVGTTKVIDVSLRDSTYLNTICVWAVSDQGKALYRKGVTKSNPLGESWVQLPCSELLETISCGYTHQVWASTKTGFSYCRLGITRSNPVGDEWELVEPPEGALIKKVSVAGWTVWALDREGKIYFRREVTPACPKGAHWELTTTSDIKSFKDFSICGDEVWAITSSDTLVRRLGVTSETPGGYSWSDGESANWKYVSARGYLRLNDAA